MEPEGIGLAVEDRYAHDVCRQQVAGELYALELEVEQAGEDMRKRGLADPGEVLDEQVSVRKQTGEGETNHRGFAHQHATRGVQCRCQFGMDTVDAVDVMDGSGHRQAVGSGYPCSLAEGYL